MVQFSGGQKCGNLQSFQSGDVVSPRYVAVGDLPVHETSESEVPFSDDEEDGSDCGFPDDSFHASTSKGIAPIAGEQSSTVGVLDAKTERPRAADAVSGVCFARDAGFNFFPPISPCMWNCAADSGDAWMLGRHGDTSGGEIGISHSFCENSGRGQTRSSGNSIAGCCPTYRAGFRSLKRGRLG